MTGVRVLVLGNRFGRDDAIAPLVADALRPRLPALDWRDGFADPLALLDAMEGAARVVLLDAVRGGGRPGEVVRIEVDGPLPPGLRVSTHAADPATALALARALGRPLPRITVIGIEAAEVGPGPEPSPELRAAFPRIVAEVEARLSEVLAEEERCTRPR